ncbi:MAG: 16S rRNA (cytosine(967)-C(5))-methyltransferase RsmB [Blastocatellia bacterium]|nr:MAG: 16S rRNA (cytosine(967)-C(5))-methyltransferase RsmB [Blastocatellia bacterium]
MSVSPARLAAFSILRKVEAGAFSSVLLAAKESELQPLDRALSHELVLGVLRWQLYLDKIIEHFTRRKVKSLDLPVLLILRLGVYQLRFLSRVPASAVVNDAVNLVGLVRLSSAKAFVNAVLRRATREPNYDPVAGISTDVERLAIQASHPEWLIERWSHAFGLEMAEEFARANNETPPTAIRVVRRRDDESEILARIGNAGGVVQASQLATGAWRVAGAVPLIRELVASGKIYVQDEASQLVANSVEVQKGDRVLDVCAAPGGKTTQIADCADNGAFVGAADLSLPRLTIVRESARRQHLNSVRLVQLDATGSLPFASNCFDRVLVDAPCSGTGTLRRNPEIRWRITPEDIQILSNRQRVILDNAARVLRSGGRLVYSTCSVEPEENEQVVESFLNRHSEFRRAPIRSLSDSPSDALRTWPHRDGADGFFMAALEKE